MNQRLDNHAKIASWNDAVAYPALAALELGKLGSEQKKNSAEILERLADKLRIVEDFKRIDSRFLTVRAIKSTYRQRCAIECHAKVRCLEALSDRSILAVSNKLAILTQNENSDEWSTEVISPLASKVAAMARLPNGDIALGQEDGIISCWNRDANGNWNNYELTKIEQGIKTLQVHPDARLFLLTASGQPKIVREEKGHWTSMAIIPGVQVSHMRLIPDGRILVAEPKSAYFIKMEDSGPVIDQIMDLKNEGSQVKFEFVEAFPDGKVLISSSNYLYILEKDESGRWEELTRSRGSSDMIYARQIADGAIIVGRENGSIHIFMQDGERWGTWEIADHSGGHRICSAASMLLLQDGRILTGGTEGMVRVHDEVLE